MALLMCKDPTQYGTLASLTPLPRTSASCTRAAPMEISGVGSQEEKQHLHLASLTPLLKKVELSFYIQKAPKQPLVFNICFSQWDLHVNQSPGKERLGIQ